MLRSTLVSLCRLLLRIFFRRIEIVGEHHLPRSGSVILTANHPNGLLDPLLVLCLVPRRISFLAKEPLFRTPLVGTFVRAFESLPVYRAQDGADPSQNRRMIQHAVELLGRGNVLGLFPEGTSHSDPQLRVLRTGAARIALSARSAHTTSGAHSESAGPADAGRRVSIVPVFLYYEQKSVFRSRAVLAYGAAIDVPVVPLDEAHEPPRERARELTDRIREAITRIAPTASTIDALVLAESAERILEVTDTDRHRGPTLAERMSERRRLLDAYEELHARDAGHVDGLIERLSLLRAGFERVGVPIDVSATAGARRSRLLPRLILAALLLVPGGVGALLHFPAYRAVHFIATKYSGTEADVLATFKLIAGLLLLPLTWLLVGGAVAFSAGGLGFLVGVIVAAMSGLSALWLQETFAWFSRQRHLRTRSTPEFTELLSERTALAHDIRALLERA